MAYCKNCGNDVTGVKFCGRCGSSVEVQSVQPVNTVQQTGSNLPTDGMGIAGFICGLLGVLACCGITSIPGLICSLISMSKVKKGLVDPSNKWMGITGLVLSIIGIVLLLIVLAYYIFVIWLAFESEMYA